MLIYKEKLLHFISLSLSTRSSATFRCQEEEEEGAEGKIPFITSERVEKRFILLGKIRRFKIKCKRKTHLLNRTKQ